MKMRTLASTGLLCCLCCAGGLCLSTSAVAAKPAIASKPAVGPEAKRSTLPAVLEAEASKNEVGKRIALVIGNANYKNVTPLSNPVNDSQDICDALKKLRFTTDCRVNLPTRRAIRDAVSEFTAKIKPEDVALFYFAGHGIEADGENYLIPINAEIQSKAYLEDEGVRVSFIFDELAEAKARLSIIMLDACRNNPFAKVRALSGTGLKAPTAAPVGSILIFPTSPGKTAMDGVGRNGVFTNHLLKHIQTPGITIEEMFKRVIDGVSEDAKKMRGEQVPWMNLSFTGEFCFVGCGTRVNTDEYVAVLKEKEKIEQTTMALKGELESRQSELQEFKQRMIGLQRQLDDQKGNQTISQAELARLNRERDELAGKTAQLQSQEQELRRVKNELAELEKKQAEFATREQEIIAARERIASLEQEIVVQERNVGNRGELDALKREREDLLKRNQALQALQGEADSARQELQNLRTKLVEFDRQRKELDEYKVRMAQLEQENKQKDESFRKMRAELENRQNEIKDFKDRMVALQVQLESQKGNQRVPQSELVRLNQEREDLAMKARQLEAREAELKKAREDLARMENIRLQSDRREQQMAGYSERIAQLEAELARKNQISSQQELAVLKQEREELVRRNADLQRQQPNLAQSQQEMEQLRQRLVEYDRQKVELDGYKKQLLALEDRNQAIRAELGKERTRRLQTEEKLKDAATSTVKDAAFVAPAL